MMKKEKTKVKVRYLYRNEWREHLVSVEKIHEQLVSGKYAQRVSAVQGKRLIKSTGGMADGLQAAEDLPQVFPSVGPGGTYTGLVLLSVPVEGGQERVERLRRLVNGWEHTLLSFVGCSGRSIELLLSYSLPDGTLPVSPRDVELFRQYAYRRAADYVLAATGLRAEEMRPDGTESCRLSSDAAALLNPQVRPVTMKQPVEPLTEATADVLYHPVDNPMAVDVLPGYTRQEMDVMKFNLICRKLAFGRWCPPDEYLLHVADECRRAGIDQEVAAKCIIWQGSYVGKDSLVRSCVENAYCKHRMGCRTPVDRSLMHQQLLEAFLRRRYQFRRNRVTGDVEFMEKDRYILTWRPLTKAARNDINNAAISENIKAWPQDLDRIVLSERTPEYDAVKDWLDGLPKWDGRDRLGELAARVPTATPGWTDNFRVWMRSMVSQWMGGTNRMYGAQMVFMLTGGQGTHKSTFMRLLLPEELRIYYIDRLDFSNKTEMLRALSRFLLINIDEYDQVSKAQTAYLKHLIQRTDVKQRKMYETTYEQQQRYAVFCATTNSLMPLKDQSGSRRYMVVEVNGIIDTDTTGDRRIDYSQLYAQLMDDLANGRDSFFDGERERAIVENNAQYYDAPAVEQLFDDLFRHPQAGDTPLLLSPTEVLQKIKERLKVDVVNQSNATIIGSHLKRQGYDKEGRCYKVVCRE